MEIHYDVTVTKHVLLMYGHHAGDEGKQLTLSYVGNLRGPGGQMSTYYVSMWTQNGSLTHESFDSEDELGRESFLW